MFDQRFMILLKFKLKYVSVFFTAVTSARVYKLGWGFTKPSSLLLVKSPFNHHFSTIYVSDGVLTFTDVPVDCFGRRVIHTYNSPLRSKATVVVSAESL